MVETDCSPNSTSRRAARPTERRRVGGVRLRKGCFVFPPRASKFYLARSLPHAVAHAYVRQNELCATMKFLSACLALAPMIAVANPTTRTLEGAGATNPSKYLWKVADVFQTRIRGPAKLGYRAIGSSPSQVELTGQSPTFQPANDYGCGDIPMCVRVSSPRLHSLLRPTKHVRCEVFRVPPRQRCETSSRAHVAAAIVATAEN